jgi:protein phosphatase
MKASSKYRASGFGLSHVGKVRQRNEDALFVDGEGRFALVADGMGGHKGGMEASRMTVELVSAGIEKNFRRMEEFSDEQCRGFLRDLFQQTSRQVYEKGSRDTALAHMGTTLVAWVLLKNEYFLAHVGDSRAYLIRDGGIFQMTMDHSFVNEQIASGAERDCLFDGHNFKNAIFRNIGMMPPSEPSIAKGEVCEGDVWVMCSDGLSNKMQENEILDAVKTQREAHGGKRNFLADACHALVNIALERGGEDNISVLIFETVTR